jgi:hypothetical protein
MTRQKDLYEMQKTMRLVLKHVARLEKEPPDEIKNGENKRERKGESASVGKQRQERHLEIPEFGEKHVFTKRGRMQLGTY